MTPCCPITGIILSGGASRRMGVPKALLQFENETFLDRLIRLLAPVADPIIVVLGHQSDRIRAGMHRAAQVTIVVNPDPERGMLSSLQCGLLAVPATAEAVMFTPVDHPNILETTIQQLAGRFVADRAPATVPEFHGGHGHPVCISRALIEELLALPATAQARDVIHKYVSQTVYLPVTDRAITIDIDTPSQYAELLTPPTV